MVRLHENVVNVYNHNVIYLKKTMNKLPEVDIMAINSPPRTSKLISSSTRNFCRLKPQSRRQLDDLSTSYIKSLTTKCGCLANGGGNVDDDNVHFHHQQVDSMRIGNDKSSSSGGLKRRESFLKRILRKAVMSKSKSCDNLHVL